MYDGEGEGRRRADCGIKTFSVWYETLLLRRSTIGIDRRICGGVNGAITRFKP